MSGLLFPEDFPSPVLDTIIGRRSTRTGFAREPLSEGEVGRLIRAGNAAPSSKKSRPWRFHVLTTPTDREAIADLVRSKDEGGFIPRDNQSGLPHAGYVSTVQESADTIALAPTSLVVENTSPFSGGRKQLSTVGRTRLTDGLIGYGLEMIGIGAAIQNILLEAEELGLGAVFIGDIQVAAAEIERLLSLSGDLVGIIAVGHNEGTTDRKPVS